MIIFTILIAIVFLIGALVLWAIYLYAELKGYEKALSEIEQMIDEVWSNEKDKKQ